MTRATSLITAALALAGCITEQDVVERSTDAVSADLQRALQEIGELRVELTALRAQVGTTDETATLEDRVRGLTQEGFAGRVQSLEVWREEAAEPSLASLDSRVSVSEGAIASHDGRLGTLETWRVAVDGSLVDHETRIGALEADVIDLIDAGSAIGGRVTDLETWRTSTADPTLTAHAASIGALDDGVDDLRGDLGIVSDTLDDNEARWITEDTTWEIGPDADYETPEEAWTAALGKRVVNGAVLTLQLLDGEHELEDTWVLNHPDGLNLRIVGNEDDPGAVVVRAAAGLDGLRVSDGHAMGTMDSFTIEGTGGVGLTSTRMAFLNANGVVVRGFSVGARSTSHSVLASGVGGLTTEDCGEGVEAFLGSTLDLESLIVDGTTAGEGLTVVYNSTANIPNASISDTASHGISAALGGWVIGNAEILRPRHYGVVVNASAGGALNGSVRNAGWASYGVDLGSHGSFSSTTSTSPGWFDYYVGNFSTIYGRGLGGGRSVSTAGYHYRDL